MLTAIRSNMKEKTGKTLEQWVKLVKKDGPADPKSWRGWLKSAHGLGHVTAGVVAMEAQGKDRIGVYEKPDELVDAMYSGPKADLRPIHDALVKVASKLGKDVQVSPCKTYVALRRKKQFAIVKPSTKTRVDLGLCLPDIEPEGRLEPAKSAGSDRVTHHIKLESAKEIDAEVKRWLKAAYEASA
jgi:predicted transport protein